MVIRRLLLYFLTIASIFLCCAEFANAGTLTGTIINSETIKGIPEAKVTLTPGTVVSVSDKNGRFRLFNVKPGTYTIRIRKKGFFDLSEKITISQRPQNRSFVLAPEEAEGETIEISEKAPLVIKTPGQTRLEREELTLVPGARGDSLQVIKNLPGIANANAPGSGPGLIVVRGSAPEDSLFLLDGVSIPILYHFFGIQSIIPSEFIDDIEYIPGGFGAEYGQSTGGIFHIHTRPARSEKWNGFTELSFINLAAYAEGPVNKKINLSMAVRRSTIDFILPLVIPDDAGLNFTTMPSYYDAQLRLDYRHNDRHSFSFFNVFSFDQLSLLIEKENPNDPAATGKFDNETQFFRSINTWKYRNPKIDNDIIVAFGQGHFRVEVGQERYLRVKGFSGIIRDNFLWRISQKIRLKAGGNLFLSKGSADIKFPLPPQEGSGKRPNLTTDPILEWNEETTNNRAGTYLAAEINPMKKLEIVTGLRYDYYDRISSQTLSPRLSLKYDINNKISARLGLGSYSRTLSQAEAGPKDLKPELATQYVAGVETSRGIFKGNISLFYTNITLLYHHSGIYITYYSQSLFDRLRIKNFHPIKLF